MGTETKNKQNRFSRERITTALIQLAREKPLSSISIQELTDSAGVSRMTFYRNYASMEDVLISRIHDILEQYREDDADYEGCGEFYDAERVRHGLDYFYQHKDFVASLACCGLSDVFLRELTEFAFDKWLPLRDDPEQKYRLASFVGILFNGYMTWIRSSQGMSFEELSRQIATTCKKAFS